ncbi:hypothetical protein M9458_050680 [Cirrhinus mrigala]|uniref:Gypsy retrotransposon integrase-like protein 1 n=1 Tax=Cirrhinus mrigala TaxID=683832 RepID=A0ABD0MZL5_CIRMR
MSHGRSLWLPLSPTSGNPHRSSKTTFPIIPCLGLPLPVPGLPVHFLFVGHFTALRGLALREVLLVMLSILSVLSSDCLLVANRTVYCVCEPLLPAFYRPSRSPWIIPFDRRQPRPIAWTLTTRLDLPSPHLSAVVDPSLLFTSKCLIKLLQMDPTPPDSSVTPLQKTSPPTDPATADQIASEVSAQATMLTRHQQHTTALIDSGAAGNLIDADFVRTNHLPILSCVSPVAVAALDGRPLGTGRIEHTTGDLTLHTEPQHKEIIRFFIITSPRTPLILGYPWLHQHEPTISWSEATITHWSSRCQPHSSQPAVQLTASPEPHGPRSIIPEEYQDLLEAFSTIKATHLPPHRTGDCAIDLVPGALPPRGRVFPLSQPESEAMNQYIQEELAKGFIRPSTSPASAGFFFVKKKDGGLRPCIDYRALNAITVKYRYPLPLVPSALEQLRTAKIYTKLDLRSAYNLIRIREGDEWKTAFSTTSGHYEYRVMPFGLANSPSYFQAFINEVFRDMLNRWVIVYIDDILIYSDSYSEHVQHVRAVLQRLVQHQLYAKQEKCEFHQQSISFLGYIVSPEGVAMDESKVTAVRDWPRPKTLKELQRFLGFSNFYRRFIRSFSSVASPLTSMIKKGDTRLSWSPVAIQAFEELRRRFTTAPILHHPDPNRPFLVEVDASSTGVGAVLSQRQGLPPKTVPCAFYSHKLSPAERNYDVGNRELLAIKLALEEWRHWLEGACHPFTILTDHRNLEYLRSAKVLNHRQARWSLFFTRFHFEITYRPGSQNTKADALSRIHEPDHALTPPESILPPSVIVAPVAWDIMTEIAEGHTQDPPPNDCPENLTYVPLNLRTRVLSEVHSTPSSGHPGIEATIQLLHNRFWWPSLRTDVITFIKNCSLCNTSKTPRQLPAGLLQPLPAPRRPWSHIAVDFITNLPSSLGHTTILTVIDRFSKGCRLIPLPKLPTAMETAEALCNLVFRFYGLPEDIISDRGPQFTSLLWSSFFRLLGVNISLTSGYHPQANGQAERLNQELTRFLRSYCQDHQEDWSRFILWAEYAQNSIRKPSTNLTPFQCILGFQPPLFPWSGEPSELPAVNSWFQQSEETWNLAHVHLQRAIRRTKTQADRRRQAGPPYEPGQWVWLSTRDLRLRLPCKKLSPRYVGPFKISRQITPVSFRLELPPEYRISPTFHVSLLKPAGRPGGVEDLEGTVPQGPTPLIIDGEEVYRVNMILDSRRRRGRLQYLVDWEDYGPEERSWVPAVDILDPSLLTDYHTSHPDRPGPRRRGRPRRRLPPRARRHSRGGALSHGRSLWLPLSPTSGNPHRSSKTTFPIIPCLGLPLPVPGLPVHFLFVGHFTALRGLALREVLKRKAFNDELKNLIKELNSDFEKNHPTLTDQIKKVQNITDELKSMHKKTTVGSLTGAALGAAGGITAGLFLAPITFGASLALTGAGAAAEIVGGATGATCTITNMIKQKNLRETIEKIISDAQNTIKSMIKQLSKISDNIEEIEQLKETMNQEGVKTARGATDISELKHEIGKVSALADKDMLVFVKAANVASACADAAEAAYSMWLHKLPKLHMHLQMLPNLPVQEQPLTYFQLYLLFLMLFLLFNIQQRSQKSTNQ